LPLVLAAMRLSFQPYGSSTEYQPVAEPARYFLLTAVEAGTLALGKSPTWASIFFWPSPRAT
jgi:hypothetical protein